MSPEFLHAAERHAALAERLGPEHPDVMMAMVVVLEHAPASLKETIRAKAVELGLMPEPDGYLEDGSPVFSLEAVAAKLGAPVAQVEETMRALLALREDAGLPIGGMAIDGAMVHRRH